MAVTVLDGSSQIAAGTVRNAEISASAAIAYSKLNLATSIVNADIAAGAAIAASKLNLTSLPTPANAGDAATKGYVDSTKEGLDPKDSVRVATTTALAAGTYNSGTKRFTETANGALSVDGVSPAVNDRVLVKDQATGSQNGIYKVIDAGSGTTLFILERTTDNDTSAEMSPGSYCWVEEGTTNGDSGWFVTTNAPITLDTTAITWSQFSGAGQITAGAGLTKTGNTLDVVSANGGIVVNADNVALTLDGTTLAVGVPGLKVAASGVTSTEIATTVAGAGLLGGAGTALAQDLAKQSFTGDGTTTAFTLTSTPMTDGELVFKGGSYQKKGAGNDYTISGAVITFATAPANLANIEAHYWKA